MIRVKNTPSAIWGMLFVVSMVLVFVQQIHVIQARKDSDYLDTHPKQGYRDNGLQELNQTRQLFRKKIVYKENTYVVPPFHEAMTCHQADEASYLFMRNGNKFLEFLKKQYDSFILNGITFSKNPKIPKIIHQIWIGPNKPPVHFERWRDSWLKLHPTWEYILWDEEKIAQLTLHNKEFIDAEQNYGAKSDLIRYEIIYQFGGLYIDVDFEALRPFDFLHHSCDFYGSFFEVKRWPTPSWLLGKYFIGNNIVQNDNAPRIVNGIFAASKHHPLVEELIMQAKNFREKKHILTRVGPDYFKTIVGNMLPLLEGKNVILPSNYFFSWGNKFLNIMPETLAVHHYTGTWGTAYVKDKKTLSSILYALQQTIINFILAILPKDKIVLEFGSSLMSSELSKQYTLYSVEHDAKKLNKYAIQYIYAPLKNGWYDSELLRRGLPLKYDLVLVGADALKNDQGACKNFLNIVDKDAFILFDGVHKEDQYLFMKKVAQSLRRNFEVFNAGSGQQFGVLMPLGGSEICLDV